MPTRRISPDNPEPDIIAEAAAHLRAGHLVAFPTETVYGLGANALDPEAVARIYAAKGRPSYNPLIVHLASAGDASQVASAWPDAAARLSEAFWPGPLTLVVPRRDEVPDAVSAGLPTVGVRVPAHPVAHALLVAAGVPVAAPSANRSTELSPTRARHVERALGERVAMILDGGPTTVGIESTVVDVTGTTPVLLRPGGLSRQAIEAVVGALRVPAPRDAADAPLPSPGMMERHYAPRTPVLLFAPADASRVAAELQGARATGKRIGALLHGRAAGALGFADEVAILPPRPAEYASRLYDALHDLDEAGCDVIAVERVPASGDWDGVRDRLERAARPA